MQTVGPAARLCSRFLSHSSRLPLLSLFAHLRTAATDPLTTTMTGVINALTDVRSRLMQTAGTAARSEGYQHQSPDTSVSDVPW